MLDDAHNKSSRDPSKERGENNSPDHGFSRLVAGKADGVARVVRRVVQLVGMGDSPTPNTSKMPMTSDAMPATAALRNGQREVAIRSA